MMKVEQVGDRRCWDLLPCIVMVIGPDGAASQVNRAYSTLTGVACEAALEKGWMTALESASQAEILQALAQRHDFTLQLRMLRVDGQMGWIGCTAHWQADAGSFVCVLHDVSPEGLAALSARAKAEQLRLLADNLPVLIAYYSAVDFKCLFANKQYAQTFGFDVRSIVGNTVEKVIGEAAAQQIRPYVEQAIRERKAVSYERQLPATASGGPRWIEVNLVPHHDAEGAVVAAYVLITDISKHRRAEQAMRESEDRLAKFMQASAEGILFHQDGVIMDANPSACDLMGCTLQDLLGRNTLEFIAPDQVQKTSEVLTFESEASCESVLLRGDGTRIPVELIVRSMIRNGERVRMTIARDIRDRLAAQARIHRLAHHDSLTGLFNRATFIERLQRMMTTARVSDAQAALLFIDLDHFKRVNDSLGHLAGDQLLQTVAARITDCLRARDIVARFGGDEFLVLLTGSAERGSIEEVAQKLHVSIEAPLVVDGRVISISPSIGIALYPQDGHTPSELIKHADAAMYLAKARGRANYQFFNRGMADAAYAALVLEGQLAEAVALDEFVLHFQPQVRADDGVVVGLEALIRWKNPQHGLLLPDEFIPLAEQRRWMILAIGGWTLREAVRCAARWQQGQLAGVPVAVNLSTLQFQADGFVEGVAEVLRQEGLDGSLLEFELTERMLMSDLPQVKNTLSRLRALGIHISVDDFGTGYTSLSHLKELPIDKMKIDSSFVRDLPAESDSVAIAKAIIQMGRSLGITVVAEGVETEVQRDFLAEQGCDELQGFAISQPMKYEALEAWTAEYIIQISLW